MPKLPLPKQQTDRCLSFVAVAERAVGAIAFVRVVEPEIAELDIFAEPVETADQSEAIGVAEVADLPDQVSSRTLDKSVNRRVTVARNICKTFYSSPFLLFLRSAVYYQISGQTDSMCK